MEILEKLKQRQLVNTKCLIIKMCFKFLFKTGCVRDHLKFIWETIPHCWTAERKDTFAKYMKGLRVRHDCGCSLVLGVVGIAVNL